MSNSVPAGESGLRRPLLGYLGALLFLGLAVGARFLLAPWMGMLAPFLTIFPALTFTVWCFGTRPALLSLFLSYLAVQGFFIPSPFDFDQESLSLLMAYLVSGGLIVLLGHRLRSKAREAEETRLELRSSRARSDAAQRKHEEELKRMQRQLQTVLDNVPALIYQIDTNNRHAYVNQAYAEFLGSDAESLVGRSLYDAFPPDVAQSFVDNNAAILEKGKTVTFEEKVPLPDGVHSYISIKTPLFNEKAVAVGILGISTDITDRKETERVLKERELALLEADKRKDEFLAVLGHELRNPLAPLTAGLELLKQAREKPGTVDSIQAMMHRQLTHLTRLVNDLLDVSRISSGKVMLQNTPLDLHAVLDVALEQTRSLISAKQHTVEVQRCAGALRVFGDFERLTEVFVNLLTNAVKYTPAGGRITVSTREEDAQAVVSVADTGYGIPMEQLQAIFKIFSQVTSPHEYAHVGGLGVGLAIARQLVELHGGKILASSDGSGKGATFTISLPLTEEAEPVNAEEVSKRDGKSRRILIVDDNVDAAMSLAALLRSDGHSVEVTHDGEKALGLLAEVSPDIVLLDIGLPGMNGCNVARRIRSSELGDKIVLIAITGWGQPEDRQRTREAGFDEHLTKPVDLRRLREVMTLRIGEQVAYSHWPARK